MTQELTFPGLPDNLNIGKAIVNFHDDSYFKGDYVRDENTVTDLDSGKISVNLYTHGIRLSTSYRHSVEIHNSQIISLIVKTRGELVADSKSVIGRAVVGSLLAGGIGAVVGGMTAMTPSEKMKDITYLIINYWDAQTQTPQSILISGDKKLITRVINRHEQEKNINTSKNRTAEKEKNTAGKVLFFLILAVLAFIGYAIFH